jgi:hypothetical protein
MSAVDPKANHPGLASPLYADAFRARAGGAIVRAWALEEQAIREPHYTHIDFACRGLAKLRHGDWSGWRDYEYRIHDGRHIRRMGARFMWTHEPFLRFHADAHGNWTERSGWERELRQATILIGREGGIGDQIMLSRFIPWLAERAQHVYWLVSPEFRRLAVYGYGDMVEVIAQDELPPFDHYVMMFSLPALVGEMVPEKRYARTWQSERWRGGEVPVTQDATGLCWAGSPLYAENLPLYGDTDIRSMDQAAARRLGIALADVIPPPRISYQRGQNRFDMGAACQGGIVTAERVTGDWFDTYVSLAKECKRVVTVDTGLAHLAGAMGLEVHTLLALDHCWRWNWGSLRADGQSVWYPSMRLYSQNTPGDWSYPIEEVVRQLKAER